MIEPNWRKISKYVLALLILLILIILVPLNQLEEILYFPATTPEEWCEGQPCVEFYLFSTRFILVQPSSTIFVFSLGFLTITIGIYLLIIRKTKKFTLWWGTALLLWGLGAVFAGISYQAFSYEIKCANRSFCIWTSLWEIFYLILSVGSVNAMLLAQSNLGERTLCSRIMKGYTCANFTSYLMIVAFGTIIPVHFLISFELMIVFLAPTILLLLIFNIRKYIHLKTRVYRSLAIIWAFLIVIIGLYFLYFMLDITDIFWEQGVWFSENDVLHISLILWMIYICYVIRRFNKL